MVLYCENDVQQVNSNQLVIPTMLLTVFAADLSLTRYLGKHCCRQRNVR